MIGGNTLDRKLAELEGMALVLSGSAEGYLEEANENMGELALTQAEAERTSGEDLLEFLRQVVGLYNRQIVIRFGRERPAVFYCWFDEQAVQLRWSLISQGYDRLPFGRQIQHLDHPRQIVERFLASHDHDGIAWATLNVESPSAAALPAGAQDDGLAVWSQLLPLEDYGQGSNLGLPQARFGRFLILTRCSS